MRPFALLPYSLVLASPKNSHNATIRTMKDKIFSTPMDQIPPFSFNENVANVFDDMISRSIPFYHEMQTMVIRLAQHYIQNNSTVYDLGCATGHTFAQLIPHFSERPIQWVGIDNSKEMLEKAQDKWDTTPHPNANNRHSRESGNPGCSNPTWHQADLTQATTFPNASLILSILTIQFIPINARAQLLKNMASSLQENGAAIIVEKIKGETKQTEQQFIDLYHQYKADRGYSELEIAQKRDALENVLVPLTLSENISELKKAGFSHVEPFFRWFNFAGLIALK